jgi:hypothetical protein
MHCALDHLCDRPIKAYVAQAARIYNCIGMQQQFLLVAVEFWVGDFAYPGMGFGRAGVRLGLRWSGADGSLAASFFCSWPVYLDAVRYCFVGGI